MRDGIYLVEYHFDEKKAEVEIYYDESDWWVKDENGVCRTVDEFRKVGHILEFVREFSWRVDKEYPRSELVQRLRESIKNHRETPNYLPYPNTPITLLMESIDHQIFALSQNIKALNAFFETEVFSNFLSFLQFPYELKNNILYVYASNVRREIISKLDITSCKEFIKNNIMMVKGDNIILFLDTNKEIKDER